MFVPARFCLMELQGFWTVSLPAKTKVFGRNLLNIRSIAVTLPEVLIKPSNLKTYPVGLVDLHVGIIASKHVGRF